jgi:hypothetical protein
MTTRKDKHLAAARGRPQNFYSGASSIEEIRLGVGAVNSHMTTGSPAGAEPDESGMIDVAKKNRRPGAPRHGGLCVAADAEIRVTDRQHLIIDGAVRIVAGGATFTHRRMLKDDRLGLFVMALRAIFVQPRHRQATRRFHDVHAVRVVALHAIHFAFEHGMMLGQMKLGLGIQVAFEAGFGLLAGIDDEVVEATATAHGDMFAPGTVARFAAVLAGHSPVIEMQPRMGAGGKHPGDICVTVRTGFVADKSGALNLERLNDCAIHRGTGIDQ